MLEFTFNHVQLQLSFVFDYKENFVSIFEDQETDFWEILFHNKRSYEKKIFIFWSFDMIWCVRKQKITNKQARS